MELPVPLRRLAYRVAYAGLRAYWFVAHPTTQGVKCLLTDGELILLVRHTYGRREWDLPGGSIRRGESPLEAAQREMNEELGVAIEDWTRLEELMIDDFHRHDRVSYMTAEVRAPHLVIDHGELATAQWFSRRQLPSELGRYARAIIGTLPPFG
jgi:8-oxo-dGTP pyrophosphatase MutT (NUDIX family)